MKNIDYKGYRKLASYDIGRPNIDSGRQLRLDSLPEYTSEVTRPAEQVSSAGIVQQANANAIGGFTNTAMQWLPQVQPINNYATALSAAAQSKTIANGLTKMSNSLSSVSANPGSIRAGINATFKSAAEEASKKAATEQAAAKSLGTVAKVGGVALSALSLAQGLHGISQNMRDDSTLSPMDVWNAGEEYTQNGATYKGGMPVGLDKYVEEQNKANKIAGIGAGFTAGSGLGGIIGTIGGFGPWGGLIGAGIGGVVGALAGGLFGHKARDRRRKAMAEIKQNYAITADAYNTQNEAEARSAQLRDMYNLSHHISADKGLGLHKCDTGANALMGPFESKIETTKVNGKTRIKSAETKPGIAGLPYGGYRMDIIPEYVGNSTAIIGNKYDEGTGVPFSLEAIPFVNMFNSQNPYEKAIGEKGLLSMIDEQSKTKNNNPSPYETSNNTDRADMGKKLKKYDDAEGKPVRKTTLSRILGNPIYNSGILQALSYLNNIGQINAFDKRISNYPIQVNRVPTRNENAGIVNSLLPTYVDVREDLNDVNKQYRNFLGAVDQSAISPGMRMISKLAAYNSAMQNRSKILAGKVDRMNALAQNAANMNYQIGESNAQRALQEGMFAEQNYAKALANKYYHWPQTVLNAKIKNTGELAQNLNNLLWGGQLRNIYHQDTGLTADQIYNMYAK